MLYDFLIEANNHPERPSKAQEGDIKCMRPSGKPWGKKERCYSLIVPVDITETEAKLLMSPLYEDGSFPPEVEAIEKMGLSPPETVHKRRFKLPLSLLKNKVPQLDLTRVRDREDPYQPFIDGDLTITLSSQDKIAIFYDKHKKSFKYCTGAVEVNE